MVQIPSAPPLSPVGCGALCAGPVYRCARVMMFQSGPMGLFGSLGAVSKIVLLILFLFSVISWAIILYKWRAFRLSDQEDQRFLSAYSRARDGNDLRRQIGRASCRERV